VYRLMVITDRRRARRPLLDVVRAAVGAGADAIQLRERDLPDAELFRLAEECRAITAESRAALIINRRLDVALAAGADGVQLGWTSLAPEDARAVARGRLRIGVSCHDDEQLRAAEAANADYAVLGPVFDTPSKRGLVAPLGLDLFTSLARGTGVPVLAVGGITAERAGELLGAGATGVAVISAVMAADDPAGATHALLRALASRG